MKHTGFWTFFLIGAFVLISSQVQAQSRRLSKHAQTIVNSCEKTFAALKPDSDMTLAREAVDKAFDELLVSVAPREAEAYRRVVLIKRFVSFCSAIKREDLNIVFSQLKHDSQLTSMLLFARKAGDKDAGMAAMLAKLLASRPTKVKAYPALTAAFCLVHDEPLGRDIVENSVKTPDLVALFDYFVDHRKFLAHDISRLPPEILVYLVDVTGTIDDLKWALKQYRGQGRFDRIYFGVPYDKEHFFRGVPKKVSTEGFNLPNLKKYGGICADQAYFATTVGKAIGLPTAWAKGEGGQVFHAWAGYLQPGQGGWDFRAGRYASYQNLRGMITEPQTRQVVPESHVSFSSGLVGLSDRQRWDAASLTEALARMLNNPPEPLDSAALRKLGIRKAPTWIDFFQTILRVTPSSERAWKLVAHAKTLTLKQRSDVANMIIKLSGRRFPDFTISILKPLVHTMTLNQQYAIWQQVRGVFRGQPEMEAEVLMVMASLFERSATPERALPFYKEIITRYGNNGPFVVDAIARADAVDKNTITSQYEYALKRLDKPGQFAVQFRKLSNWYRVASMYEKRLREVGLTAAADKIKREIAGEIGR